ncbi:fanconi-associated nuclease 1 [Marchantia polymorpha subsp. ruderalis]|uniref:Fanconi-associated nuclease n=2 Tax=Marchantia polymorpha TaxID=3197 RepID=A0AAF6ALW3_MARPO|nr:hypothetical protein MARPO_0005s0042 [Marchantia polymorpha]BBM97433.1 hypothetical protein Mp_1g05650 [Marchantia polymorpha subsp. ruderalis]|eukprot:PTQ48370.1 hypothetical protein MARPO_0005s0042 [Marchantia polymorpha]
MLRGHDSLTRLIGKRRRLSLSAISPNKRALCVSKNQVEEFSLLGSTVGSVKEESVEIRCSSSSSVNHQQVTEAETLLDGASSKKSLVKVKVECVEFRCSSSFSTKHQQGTEVEGLVDAAKSKEYLQKVKQERVEYHSVNQEQGTEAESLVDAESTKSNLLKVKQEVVKVEAEVNGELTQCPTCSKTVSGGLASNTHQDFCRQGGASEGKQKIKQSILSRFFSPGVNKLSSAPSSSRVHPLLSEEKQTSFVTIKTEDILSERPLKPPLSSRSRLKLKKVKVEIKHEDDNEDTGRRSQLDSLGQGVLLNGAATSVGLTAWEATSSKSLELSVVPVETKVEVICSGTRNHVDNSGKDLPLSQSAKINCSCSCHLSTEDICKLEGNDNSRESIEMETYTEEYDSGRDLLVVVKDKTTPTGFLPSTNAEDLSLSTSSTGQLAKNSLVGTLETRIVGRRYNRGIFCEEGMQVTLLRDPENPKDPNAIKVVPLETPLGPAVGHLPKEISAHLAPLLDKAFVHVQGFVVTVPEQIHGDVPLKLSFESASASTDLSLLDGAAESWQSMLVAAENVSSGISPTLRVSKYQHNFLAVMRTVLERDSHLFEDQEKHFLGTFYALSGDAQRLFIRLYQRKGPWFRLSSLSYKDVADVTTASDELLASGFMSADCSAQEEPGASMRTRIEILNMLELRQLSALLKKKKEAASARREELVSLIVSTAMEKQWNIEVSSSSRSRTVMESVAEITGPCIRVSEQAEFLLWRLQRLFFLDKGRDLSSFLVVDMGLVKYPQYKCLKSRHVFPSHEALVAYEQALEVAQGMDMSLELNDTEKALEFLRRARNEMSVCQVVESAVDKTPSFLARFSASYVYRNVITVGVSILERERRYKEAVEVLKELLRSKVRSGRWGYWTLRLSVNLDHLGCKEESLKVAESGVNEPWIRGGDRVALQRRVVRLGKPPRRWKRPPYADSLNRKCKEVQIRGRPLNCVTGKKSRFYGYDGEQCGVEELALQYYASEEGGAWQGVHCEGGVWLTLFGLLMWDVLFAEVPDVFQNPFQTAPLDLNTDLFYPSRQDLIETRLAAIAVGNTESIVTQSWNKNFGTMCDGVNWERHSLAELLTIATCIGGSGLSHVCRLLAEDHAGWRGGMPDLLLWRTSANTSSDCSKCSMCGCSVTDVSLKIKPIDSMNCEDLCLGEEGCKNVTKDLVLSTRNTALRGEAKLVEVKGPRDRLSEQQMAWIWILMNGGLSVEVCKVLEELKD